jgi:hypothetical protein
MDKQLIQRLAREAGFLIDGAGNAYVGVPGYGASELRGGELLQRFATRVAEECAKICEDVRVPFARDDGEVLAAEAIRAAFKVTEA